MTTTSAFDTALSNIGIKRASTGVPTTDAKAATTLGQADFLKLMTAQMQNQDPFAPVDNTQMIAQMAQFSSVAGISEMNTTLKAIGDKLNATSASDAMGYIGKTVLTAGTTAYARTTGGIAGGAELDADASDVRVTISGANGEVLKTLPLGAEKAGKVDFDWDGKTQSGEDAGSGPFTVTVAAQNNGTTVHATPLVWAPVQSVSTKNGAAVLTLPGLGQIDVGAVREIG